MGEATTQRGEARMTYRCIARLVVVATGVVSMPLVAVAQSTEGSAVPHTSWGKPDLQGIWDFRTITPLERPDDQEQVFLSEEEVVNLEREAVDRDLRLWEAEARRTEAGGNVGGYNNFWMDRGTTPVETRRTSLIVDPPNGKFPDLSPVGQRRSDARRAYLAEHPADSWLDRNTSDRCIVGFNAGPPITPLAYNQNMQLFQTPDTVVILTEMVHTARVVPLDGRPMLDEDIRLWSGDSRGHWEGDTLVVRTQNFNDERRWIPLGSGGGATGTTANMTLVERFTRLDVDTLEYTFTVSDSQTWARPWTASMPMRRTDTLLFEYACHEGNYSMEGILSGARSDEKAGAQDDHTRRRDAGRGR